MTTHATDKINHQPNAWCRLAAWPALVAQVGQRLAARVCVGGAASVLALMVWSGVWLSSFGAEATPPQIPPAEGAADVKNNARVTPFILVVKTDQLRIKDEENSFFTSGPNQFRLPLHPFAHYDFTIDWGDGTIEVVRSDAPAGQAIVDEAWLALVKKGLDQSVTFEAFDLTEPLDYDYKAEKKTHLELWLENTLEAAEVATWANIVVDPKVLEKAGLQRAKELVSGQTFETMKLSEAFGQLTKLTGLNYVLHDWALLITERKELPSLVCPRHTYAQAGTYTVKITENVIGGFPQIYFNGGYDCVKVSDLAQWGGNTWTSLDAAFKGCANMVISASDAATALTGAVKDFSQAWLGCESLTVFPLLNTAAGTDFSHAWGCCGGLTSFPLLNTSAGTDFRGAWNCCGGLTIFPLLNTSAGTDFGYAWARCSCLTIFPLLNTSAGTNFTQTWAYCSGLTNFPLLNTSAGTYFSRAWVGCSDLTIFPLLNTSAGTNFTRTWANCSGLTNFPLLNTSAGTNFTETWLNCLGLTNFPLLNTSAGIDFCAAWAGCSNLTIFPLLNTSTGTIFAQTWGNCSGLTNFPLLNTSAGIDFCAAWAGCSGLRNFPLLNTSAGTDFSSAWDGCSGLKNFPLLDTFAGTDFSRAWASCSNLTIFPLLNTSAGINFESTWDGCRGLKNFPLLNISAGTNFAQTWLNCSGLTNFPLLNTSAGTDFRAAWYGCSGLKNFPMLNFGKMEQAERCFSGVTLTSASYGELLANIATLNKVGDVEFDGGLSKAQGVIGIQAREKLIKKMGWTIYDGDQLKPEPEQKNARPAEIQPQPEAVNDF